MLRCSVRSFLFQRIIVLFLVCGCLGCTKLSRNNIKALGVTNDATTETDETGYVVQPNYDHPKFKELSAAFDKEAHRFEIDACEFKYNDQSFFIGDSMAKIIEIFGEPEGGKIKSLDGEVIGFKYKDLTVSVSFSLPGERLKSFGIRMPDNNRNKKISYSIVKFRKVPYQLGMTLNEFMTLSDMEHGKIIPTPGDVFTLLPEKCNNKDEIRTIIGYEANYQTIGGGHMTMRGKFDPKSTGSINSFSISVE